MQRTMLKWTAFAACTLAAMNPAFCQTSYGDTKAVETVTNEFGSTDLQMIAEKMVGSLMQDPLLAGRPTMTLSAVRNKTSEYIDTKSIMNTIQTAMVKSRMVKFVRSADEMQNGTDELQRQNQSGLYKSNSKAKIGNMTAAKYTLEGEIVSIVKNNGSTKDVYYKMTLKVYDVEEGTVEWQEEKEIRKTSKR
jgi:uncharacterized protein (TIGR02722 family)